MSFYADVIRADGRFMSTSRIDDLGLLEPVTRSRVEAIIQDAAAMGVELLVWETYRSQARQERLFAEGATQLRTVGVHHYGLAADLVRNTNGEPSWKGSFRFLSDLARNHRLIWGGDWGKKDKKPKFYDPYHVQRCAVRRQRYLFEGTWYPDDAYDPYA